MIYLMVTGYPEGGAWVLMRMRPKLGFQVNLLDRDVCFHQMEAIRYNWNSLACACGCVWKGHISCLSQAQAARYILPTPSF